MRRQCELLGLARSSCYDSPQGESEENLALMRSIDELYTRWPFYGSRRIADELNVNRKRVQRLMRLMGIEAIYPKRRTTCPGAGHKVYPYLLRGVEVARPNQVWSSDITYVPLRKGWLCLAAVMDWFSRKVLAWRLSNTMDGRGRALDNVFIERLWRSVKHEGVYLRDYQSVRECETGLDAYFAFYNGRRRHQSLGRQTPEEVYAGAA